MQEPIDSVCRHCGAKVWLVPAGLHWKWVTNINDSGSWHCGSDPNYPVRAHDGNK